MSTEALLICSLVIVWKGLEETVAKSVSTYYNDVCGIDLHEFEVAHFMRLWCFPHATVVHAHCNCDSSLF